MNTLPESSSAANSMPSANKPLWAAVGLLGAAVLAMGGTMIVQQRSAAPSAQATPAALVALAAPQKTSSMLPQFAASTQTGNAANANAADDLIEKPAAPAKKPIPAPVKKAAKPTPKPAYVAAATPAPFPAPMPARVVAAQICGNCGSIESVTPVQRSTSPAGIGIGSVAGGVAGAVLGSQVGRGNGRTAATILGAIGGGFAGHAIEKNVRKETVYQVGVRMEDGSSRSVELAQAPSVGSRVTVDGGTLRSNDGAVYRAPAPVVQAAGQPQLGSQNGY